MIAIQIEYKYSVKLQYFNLRSNQNSFIVKLQKYYHNFSSSLDSSFLFFQSYLRKWWNVRIFTDSCKNKKLCGEAVDNYSHALRFVSDCYKTQKMCNKAVSTYHYAIKFIPECYKSQETCDKAVDIYSFISDSVPDQYMT